MRDVITLQIGKCGNQIGSSFWKRLLSLHPHDKPSQFFYLADNNTPIPRSILLDLEPRVISEITSSGIFNHENIFVPNEGGGAGNNWANGYLTARSRKNEIFEMIQRESENSDMLESFFILHSIAGGTGSGMGFYLIEELKDEFPKIILQSYSVFPNNEEVSDVVQPYNSILSIKRLSRCCDSVIVMDNSALGRISSESLRIKQPSYETINSLISTVICASTCTLRTPTCMYSDLRSIINTLVPINNFNFIVPAYTPFINKDSRQIIRKTTVNDVLRRLMTNKNKLAGTETRAIISSLRFFINTKEIEEVKRSIIRVQDKQLVGFVPWMPPSFHTVIFQEDNSEEKQVSGLSLVNSSCISTLFRKICTQYDKLKRKNAFTEMYKKYLNNLHEFDESRAVVETLIEEYEKSELMSFGKS